MSFQRQVPGPDALKVARAIEKAVNGVYFHALVDPLIRSALQEIALRIVEGDENANLKHEVEL